MTEGEFERLKALYEKVDRVALKIKVLERAIQTTKASSDFTIDGLFPSFVDGSVLPEETLLRRKVQLFVTAKLEDFLSDAKKEFESLWP